LKDERSNDAIFYPATPHVDLWNIPLMFINFLKWLANSISAVISVHDTIQMECYLSRKTHEVYENLIAVNFVQHFHAKLISTVMIV
jgi:hypothetical protein